MGDSLPEVTRLSGKEVSLFCGKIHYYAKVDSTNNLAKRCAEEGAEEGSVFVADTQTRGRGKLGRSWFSRKSDGLYASILLRPDVPATKTPILTLLSAVAVAETLGEVIRETGPVQLVFTDIKWPNDVLLNSRKVCGILSEMAMKGHRASYVVIGIGVNINNDRFPPPLNGQATSLFLETGQRFSRVKVFHVLLRIFQSWYKSFLDYRFDKIFDRWCQLSSYAHGKNISVEMDKKMISGITRGLSKDGALLLERTDGTVEEIFSGDLCNG